MLSFLVKLFMGIAFIMTGLQHIDVKKRSNAKKEAAKNEKQGQKLVSSDALAVEVLHSRQFQSFCHLLTDI